MYHLTYTYDLATPYGMPRPPQRFDKRPRLNNQIRGPEVQVIDDVGKQLGVMPVFQALKLANDKALDLVEVGPTAKPPIVKILNFGKYIYQKERREKGTKSKSPGQEVKTVRIGFRTEIHDMMVRAGQTDKFLKKGHRVRLQLTLRGKEREMAHIGREKLVKFLTLISEGYLLENDVKRYPGGFETLVRPNR